MRVCEVLLVFSMRHLRQTGRRLASCAACRGLDNASTVVVTGWELGELGVVRTCRVAFPFRLPLGRSAWGGHIGGGPIGDPPWNAMCCAWGRTSYGRATVKHSQGEKKREGRTDNCRPRLGTTRSSFLQVHLGGGTEQMTPLLPCCRWNWESN